MKHGGNLDLIQNKYGINKNEIIDLSANVNPIGMPKINISLDILEHYPDPDYKILTGAISDYLHISNKNIIVGNGSTELISLFIKIISAHKTLIAMPTYWEYEQESKLINSAIKYYVAEEKNDFEIETEKLLKQLISVKPNLFILCNPNNPTGKYIPNDKLEIIISCCKKNNIFVIIDEAYAEFFDKTAINLINKFDNLIIIRAVSKFFCMPGIRLGYAATSNLTLINQINKIKDPWSVNSLANEIGKFIFTDKKYISETKSYINKEYLFIKNNISNINSCKLYDTGANFFMCKILNNKTSTDLFNYLLKSNLLIRNLSNCKFLSDKFFRFSIGNHKTNLLLIEQIKKFFEE